MKKRQRKKCHVGEFTEWGVQLVVTLSSEEAIDKFVDVFLMDVLESNGCSCGGAVYDDKLNVIVELGSDTDSHAAKIQALKTWLDGNSDVKDYKMGEVFDVWYEEYVDIDEAE